MRQCRIVGALIALCLFWFVLPALAQAAPPAEGDAKPEAAAVNPDPLGRTTPAGTIDGFIGAIAARDYERASGYLDLSGVAPARRAAVGPRLARSLQRALDRQGTITPSTQLSDESSGEITDDPDPDLENVGRLGAGEKAAPLLLRRVGSEGDRVWLVARETLKQVSAIAALDAVPLSERWLPASFTATELAGVPVSHWLTLIGGALAAFVLVWLALGLALRILTRIGWEASTTHRALCLIRWPSALFLTLLIANSASPALGLSIVARQAWSWLAAIVGPFLLAWLAMRAIDAVSGRVLERFGRRSRATATSIVRFAERVAKAIIVASAAMAMLHAFGFNVTAALAALGIGGVALALGAQKTVENLFASISIVSDRAVRIGDFCKIGGTLGTVEDIGMRSTRIRTLGRTIVTIPNSNLVNSEIENFEHRDRFLFNPLLHLSTSTPPETLKRLLEALRAVLDGDERLADRAARVRLLLPTSDRLPIEVFGYVIAADFDAFLEVQEEFTLKMLQAVAEQGVLLAPPSLEVRRKEESPPPQRPAWRGVAGR